MSEVETGDEGLRQTIETQIALDPNADKSVLKNGLKNCLRKIGVYKQSNLYRFIPSENQSQEELLAKGSDHLEFDSIFAFSHANIFRKNSLLPKEYLFNYKGKEYSYSCIIAVYDGGKLKDDGGHHFTFLDPTSKLTALKAVIYVERKS